MDKDINAILSAEKTQMKKLQEIVKKTIEEENLIIENLLHPPSEILSKG